MRLSCLQQRLAAIWEVVAIKCRNSRIKWAIQEERTARSVPKRPSHDPITDGLFLWKPKVDRKSRCGRGGDSR